MKSDELEFLPVDFGALKTHLVTDQGVFSELSDEMFALPLKTPANSLIPEKSCKVQIENCFFLCQMNWNVYFLVSQGKVQSCSKVPGGRQVPG